MKHDGSRAAAAFCRVYLASVRAEQRQCGLKLPRLYAIHTIGLWEVRGGSPDRVFWYGQSCCAYYARAQAIGAALRTTEDEPTEDES